MILLHPGNPTLRVVTLMSFCCRFSRSNIPDDEIVLAAMPLSAELRRAASTAKKSMRFAIHPQFEVTA